MADQFQITEEKIQDYVDGRLNPHDQAAMAAYLLAHPERATEIQMLRQQNEALKGFRADVLTQPVPDRLTEIVERAQVQAESDSGAPSSWRRLRLATAAAVIFSLGLATGWLQYAAFGPGTDAERQAAEIVRATFLLYTDGKDHPVDFPATQAARLQSAFRAIFDHEVQPPVLKEFGYRLVGGRLLSTAQGKLGFFLFENDKGRRLALSLWPSTGRPTDRRKLLEPDVVCTRFWRRDGYGFAIVTEPADHPIDQVTHQVEQFYSHVPGVAAH